MNVQASEIVATITVGNETHTHFAEKICTLIEESAKVRGTGIAKRNPEYIRKKLATGHAVICIIENEVAGFCYVETWSHGRYVSNSGLIVSPDFRNLGLARNIKRAAFDLARNLYPEARVFGITTSGPVMKINTELGYAPVPFNELTQDEDFWKGCSGCSNYAILESKERKMCLCTGMLAMSKKEEEMKKRLKEEADKQKFSLGAGEFRVVKYSF